MHNSLMSDMICGLFEDNFKLRGAEREGHYKGMWLGFRVLAVNDNARDRALTMCLYAPQNYVGVYVAWGDCFDGLLDITGWRMASYHDSCWRTDGVETVIAGISSLDVRIFDGQQAVYVDVIPSTIRAEFKRLVGAGDRRDVTYKRVDRDFLLGRGVA